MTSALIVANLMSLRIFPTISSIVILSFSSWYRWNRFITSIRFVVLMIRWLIVWSRWSAKLVMLVATYSRGISCSSIRIVVADLYVLGRKRARSPASPKIARAGTTMFHFLRRRMPTRSATVLTSVSGSCGSAMRTASYSSNNGYDRVAPA